MGEQGPRIPPLEVGEWDDEVEDIMGPLADGGEVFNVFSTLAHHPKLLRRWLVFANHVLFKSALSARDRELAILRTGWAWGCEYEWGHHVRMALDAGLTEEEVARVREGADAAGWSERDRALLRAVDELRREAKVGDATWAALAAHHDVRALLDLLFTVGQYTLLSMTLNTLRVELDEGLVGFDLEGLPGSSG